MLALELPRIALPTFRRRPLPDHPIQAISDARKAIGELRHADPAPNLAELTHWVSSINSTESFTPGRRARIMMALAEAALPLCEELAADYFAPNGVPLGGGRGSPEILRALYLCATEFAAGYAIARDTSEHDSPWMKRHHAKVLMRNARWLTRRLALSYMLGLPTSGATWQQLHALCRDAEAAGAFQTTARISVGDIAASSVKQEYMQALLLEMANPSGLRPRELALAFRIAGRAAAAAQIEREGLPGALFGVDPEGESRPVLLSRRGSESPALLRVDTTNCLPRLRTVLARSIGSELSESDTLFGGHFTMGECQAMLKHTIEHWGPNPPKRRSPRVSLAVPAKILHGFDNIVRVLPAAAYSDGSHQARPALQLQMDQKEKAAGKAAVLPAYGLGRIMDASASGLGLGVRQADAAWATHGALVAVVADHGGDWIVGTIRRITPEDGELRLGIQVLAAKPKTVWLKLESAAYSSVWEEHIRHERCFDVHFRQGILVDAGQDSPVSGDLLLPPQLATRGTQFDLPTAGAMQRIAISRLRHDGQHYQRAAFERLDHGRA